MVRGVGGGAILDNLGIKEVATERRLWTKEILQNDPGTKKARPITENHGNNRIHKIGAIHEMVSQPHPEREHPGDGCKVGDYLGTLTAKSLTRKEKQAR